MITVFRHHDSAKVGLLNGLINSAGIETFIKNWAGSNITEIPIPAIYPEICVFNESDKERAEEVIDEFLNGEAGDGVEWVCPHCGEIVDGILAECWSCGRDLESES